MDPSGNPDGKKSRKKILYWTGGVLGGLLLLLAASAGIAYVVLQNRIMGTPEPLAPAIRLSDFRPLSSASGKIRDALMDRDGNLRKEAVVILSDAETNALLHMASQFVRMDKKDYKAECRLSWENGALQGKAVVIFRNRPQGKNAMNLTFSAVPGFQNGKMKLKIGDLQAGRVNLPGFFRDKIAAELVRSIESHPRVVAYGKAVQYFRIRNGGTETKINVQELLRMQGGRIRLP